MEWRGEEAGPDQGPWLEVDLDAVRRNARAYTAAVGVPLLAMVKANGYGLGAIPVARALESLGPWGYGVATLAEARELREAGIDRPIVVFRPFLPEAASRYLAIDARPTIGGLAELEGWLAHGANPWHLAIDTGMNRAGIRWHDHGQLAAVGRRLGEGYEGAFTHFHSADASEDATSAQWNRFEEALDLVGRRPLLIHAANSAAGQWSRRFAGTLARPGIFLYGGKAGSLIPEPVATFGAVVVEVSPIRPGDTVSYGATYRAEADADVVTLGAGYADGVRRSLGNRGLVAFGERLLPIAGRVTMDMTMVVVPRGTVRVGDRGLFFGGPNDLEAQASRAGTISYELLTAVGPRVARRYLGGNS
jgi:alanine racemase